MKKCRIILHMTIIVCISTLLIVSARIFLYGLSRDHGSVSGQIQSFTQSSRELDNPNRGFYNIYGFVITDEHQNYEELVAQKMCYDTNELAQIQVNLRNYLLGDITQSGLDGINQLFDVLRKWEKQYIVRFLYDWGGEFEQKEPESLDIVLHHMKQLEPIFQEYQDIIFLHQGIFVGACGEMHDSRHLSDENIKQMMLQMANITSEKTYLSVRTPQQWRTLTGLSEVGKENLLKSDLAYRLGLFNDGIMGNSLDTGTYGDSSKEEVGNYAKWKRDEELAFQEELCKHVPNGGEVIIENPFNDFENAIKDMATMHITYLNQQYDPNVLNKWAATIVTEDSCFNGMDGLSYVERHLGYRLLIKKADFSYEYWPDTLTVSVTLQHVGFAPLYRQLEL